MAFKKLKLWFDIDLATMLANKIYTVYPKFSTQNYIQDIDVELDSLELKARVGLLADRLHLSFGRDYPVALEVLLKIIGPGNPKETGMFSDFYWLMPIARYIEKYGLEYPDISLEAIEEITKRNTGEYTIRPYIEHHESKTMKQMLIWSNHPNSHVRRLSCEGARPRLPWSAKMQKFINDPTPLIPILNNLKDDTSRYVQKSVANCINDILKDNLSVGKELIIKWNTGEIGPERKWIIKHALRNLIKKEDPWALDMIN